LIEVLPFETRIQPPDYHQHRPGLRRQVRPLRDDSACIRDLEWSAAIAECLSADWSETMADLGLKITLHALRHTHASQLIAAGIDVVAISRRLGHASPTITLNVYGHVFSNTDDRAAEIMEVAFSRRRTE
jgi:integrase